jgi:uracil-DNA glycosylase family 4
VKGNVFVPSEKVDNPQYVIIGEAPGFQEAVAGKPFTGPSGRLLDKVLEHWGIDRSKATMTNACLCRPPDNRTPTPHEVRCCFPRLKKELIEASSLSVVCLGNTATQVVLETREGITKMRQGLPKPGPSWLPNSEVLATFHPAACLRSADSFPSLVTDIGKLLPQNRQQFTEPIWKAYEDPVIAAKALKEIIRNYDEIVVDIEVGIEKDSDWGHAEQYQFLCIGLGYASGRVAVIGEQALRDTRVRELMGQLVSTKPLICHNGKFDLAGLRVFGKGLLLDDTMLASYVLDERQGTHGLKYLAQELLNAPNWEAEVRKYVGKSSSYSVIPRPVLYKYNAYDVACTWWLRERFNTELRNRGLWQVYQFLLEASSWLIECEIEGIKVDDAYNIALTDTYLEVLDGLERDLRPWLVNPRSYLQVQHAIEDLGLQVPIDPRTKKKTTNIEALEMLADQAEPGTDANVFFNLMMKHRREQKLYGTYVKGIRTRMFEGRVHPTFLLHGTTTGRLSCRNPNMQNVVRSVESGDGANKIRKQFIPEKGNVFVQADYSTIELRVLATEARDAYLQSVFAEGRDLHNEVALQFFGEGFTKEQRVRAKAVVYGLAYGREAMSIAGEFAIPMIEAQRYLNEFFQMIPETVLWRDWVRDTVLNDGELTSPFGRKRRFYLITRENKNDVVKEGYAFIPQSTASDICLTAGGRLRLRHGLAVRLPVHDSLLVECRAEEADKVAALMQHVMSTTAAEVYSDYVPFPVDVKIGTDWSQV